MISVARNAAPMKCDCCSKCAGSPHFMKLASANSGLNVYQHVMNHGPTHIITFIFHNTTDNAIKPDHVSDLEPKTVECPRCRHNLAHAQKLLKEFPQIDRQGIVGVCQQCRSKREPDDTCKECLIAIQRFKSALDQRINTDNVPIMNSRKGYLADLKGIDEKEMNNFKRSDTIGADPQSGLKSRIYDSFKDFERQSLLVDTTDTTLKDQRFSKSKVDKRTRSKKAFGKPSSAESNINKYLGKVIKGKGNTLNEYYFPKTTGPRHKINKLKKHISSTEVIDRRRDIIKKKTDQDRPKKGTKMRNEGKSDDRKSRKKGKNTDLSDEDTSDDKSRQKKPKKSKNSKANKTGDISSDDEDKEERLKKGNRKRNEEKSDRNKLRKKDKNIDSSDPDDTSEDGKNKPERGKKGKGKEDERKNKQGKEKNRKEADPTDKISKDERKKEETATGGPSKGKKLKSGDVDEVKSKRISPEEIRANIAQKDKVIADTIELAMKAKKDIIIDDSKLEKKQVVICDYKEADRIPNKGKDIKEVLDIKYTIISEMIDTGEMTEQKDCNICAQIDSVVELSHEHNRHGMAEEQSEIIIETKIYKYNPIKRAAKVLQLGGIKAKDFTEEDTVILNRDLKRPEGGRHPNTPSSKFQSSAGSSPSSAMSQEPKGVINFSLSDRNFIDKGWTQMPTEKVVRKMNVYRMRPAHPQLGWFEQYRGKGLMQYPTGEKLAEFDEQGRGRWFYRNGRVALDYYDAEELNAQHRVIVYSSGESDTRGRSHPVTILATFDYLGNGIVFDHAGKIRLKYNQSEGVVLDRSLGPVSTWKWHSLNDPPVLQRVMIDNPSQPDPDLLKLADTIEKPGPADEEMLALEYDNFLKDKSRWSSQKFKPFQIKMKALKVNENFSLRVMDQATVYLIFRDGTTTLKVNLGMLLDQEEIVDVETAVVGDVQMSTVKLPGTSPSIEGILEMVEEARQQERVRLQREVRLRPPVPRLSLNNLVKPQASKTGDVACDGAGDWQRKMKPASTRVYYNTNTS